MKKFIVLVSALFISVVAFAHTINWHVGDQIISTTTCSSGDNITPPTAPAKLGYHFKEWITPQYTELEYIKSSDGSTINTKVIASNTIWNVTAQSESVYGEGLLVAFGVSAGQYVSSYRGKWSVGIPNVSATINATNKTLITIKWLTNETKVYINNEFVGQTSNEDSDINTVRVLNFNNRYPFVGKLYSVNAYNTNNVLLINLIPAKRISDSAIGMYDTVSKTFFTNAGTGNFIAGPEVGALQ